MQDFIELAQKRLGISAEDSRGGTAALLGVLKDKLPAADFRGLADKIPGLADVAKERSAEAGGGLLGGLMSTAGSLLGGGGGQSLDLAGKLAGSGLSLDKVGSFAGLFADFIKDKAGAGMLAKVLGQFPELKKLMGG